MKTIKIILARYTGFLWAVLKPLGAWGVFAIAGLDAGLLGLPVDAIVAAYVYQSPSRFLLYVVMASAGSALGSLVIYAIGYSGGEALLRKRVSPERLEKIHKNFGQHPFWGLMFPAMLPPPTPFKLFVLAAAVSKMQIWRFLLAIFAGRMARFLILSFLTLKFGPGVVEEFSSLFHKHPVWLLIGVGGLLAGVLLWWMLRRKKP